MTKFDPAASFFLTLKFEPYETAERSTKGLKSFLDWLKYRFPGVNGIYSFEFDAAGERHIHILFQFAEPIAESDFCSVHQAIVEKWGLVTHTAAGAHLEKVRHMKKTKDYLSKVGYQRIVPEGYKMGRFWGTFGDLPMMPSVEYEIPEENIDSFEEQIETQLAEEGSSAGFAFVIARYASNTTVWLRDKNRFRQLLRTLRAKPSGSSGVPLISPTKEKSDSEISDSN